MLIKIVLWGLITARAAATKLVSNLYKIDVQCDEDRLDAKEKADTKAKKIAEKATKEQMKVDKELETKQTAIEKKRTAAEIQRMLIKTELNNCK